MPFGTVPISDTRNLRNLSGISLLLLAPMCKQISQNVESHASNTTFEASSTEIHTSNVTSDA